MDAIDSEAGSDQRVLDQEPDCIAIVPSHPDYVVIGTYSLINPAEGSEAEAAGGTTKRQGSLQILPYFYHPGGHRQWQRNAPYALTTSLICGRKDFPFGIYDLHFHSQYTDLLGVATSDAEIRFFRLQATTERENAMQEFEVVELGKVLVEEPHEDDGRLAIITQLGFVDLTNDHDGGRAVDRQELLATQNVEICLFASTQFGNTKLLKTCLPSVTATPSSAHLETQILHIHKQAYDLEAWTVLPIPIEEDLLILSGGDDSQVFGSVVPVPHPDSDLETLTPQCLLTDRRTHQAGVVSFCYLGETPASMNGERFILTGSYDEHIRIFLLRPSDGTPWRFDLLSEFKMPGSVWRIQLLDRYTDSAGVHFVLLIAGHTAGAFIVRMKSWIVAGGNAGRTGHWRFEWKIEKTFAEHASFVYAVAARKNPDVGQWDVVSTSFYDQKVCNWNWLDLGSVSGTGALPNEVEPPVND